MKKIVKVTIDINEKEIEAIKERQIFRMSWIQAKMDEKEPLDFILQKILNAYEKEISLR